MIRVPPQFGPLDPLAVKMFQEAGIDVRWRDPLVGRDLLVDGGPVGVDGTYTVEERPEPAAQGLSLLLMGLP